MATETSLFKISVRCFELADKKKLQQLPFDCVCETANSKSIAHVWGWEEKVEFRADLAHKQTPSLAMPFGLRSVSSKHPCLNRPSSILGSDVHFALGTTSPSVSGSAGSALWPTWHAMPILLYSQRRQDQLLKP